MVLPKHSLSGSILQISSSEIVPKVVPPRTWPCVHLGPPLPGGNLIDANGGSNQGLVKGYHCNEPGKGFCEATGETGGMGRRQTHKERRMSYHVYICLSPALALPSHNRVFNDSQYLTANHIKSESGGCRPPESGKLKTHIT